MSRPWQIHTLVFDLDDTLYAEADFVRSGFRAVGKFLATNHGIPSFTEHATVLFELGRRGTIFNEALLELSIKPTPSLILELIKTYRSHRPQISLFPDAIDCLTWARGQLNLALLTDGYQEVQTLKVEALNLSNWIECRILTDSLGREHWKPSTLGFIKIMEQMGGDPTGYVYVGDNPHKDFIGPRSLGWRTVRIRRNAGEHSAYEAAAIQAADLEIFSLQELNSRLIPVRSAGPTDHLR